MLWGDFDGFILCFAFLPDDSPIIRFFTAQNSPLSPLGSWGAYVAIVCCANESNSPISASVCGIIVAIIVAMIATMRQANLG